MDMCLLVPGSNIRNKNNVQIRQGAMNLLMLLYNKKPKLLLPLCVPLQREQYMGALCVKPIKIQPHHIASSLMLSCSEYVAFTPFMSLHLCPLHKSSASFNSFSNFPALHLTICFKIPVSSNTRGPRRVRAERGKFHIIYPTAI